MPDTTRTFLAIEIPEDRKDDLSRLRERLEPEVAGARWVSRSQYHVTLAFLGDVPNEDLDAIGRAAGEAAARSCRLKLSLKGLGAFPSPGRPRTLWVGLEGPGRDALDDLQRQVGRALTRIGHRPDGEGKFSAHVTLARFKPSPGRPPAPDLRPLVQAYAAWATDSFEINELVTFASVLRPEGPAYTALARSPLGNLTG